MLMTEEDIAKRIAGEIILSDKPWIIMKKWREIFEVSQVEVANIMQVTPSVISDYEVGRRIPGSKFIKKFVNALVEIDRKRGCKKIKEFSNMLLDMPKNAIIDIREYAEPVTVNDICLSVKGELIACSHLSGRKIFGHTIVDSIKCIEQLSGIDFFRLMGETSMRALIFTKVSIGRSPMVAVRVYPIKPAMVVMHGTQRIDELAIKLATIEQIPLVLSKIESVEKMVENLKKLTFRK
ncbi:MAG: helix-turn-helix domain-containing protein [archaeon YNP-LCB-024-027]|nr:helix-turn-helix domain-containing protein [Candidatus Culexarchaeum yellowstonense]